MTSPGYISFGDTRISEKDLRKVRRIGEPDPGRRVHVVSYPKAGRTWLRVMLSRYKQLVLGIDTYHIYLHRIAGEGAAGPQFLFTHAGSNYPANRRDSRRFHWARRLGRPVDTVSRISLRKCRDARVVFLCRDPRDVVLSYFHHRAKRTSHYPFRGTVSEFIRDPHLGLPHLLDFMNILAARRGCFEHRFLYYEDLHLAAAHNLERIFEFAGMAVNEEALARCIEYGSIANMKKLERSTRGFEELAVPDRNDPDSHKVRKGKVGSYRSELEPEDIDYLGREIDARLDPFFERYRG